MPSIEEIKRGNPLNQVMESYGIQLKRNGSSHTFKAKCPFHEDDTPSLSINTEKDGGLWNCFGCKSGGDVISFVERIESIPTKEAINKLSATVKPSSVEPQKRKPEIKLSPKRRAELLKEVVRVYHQSFKESKSAQDYLEKRGLKNKALWEHYQIGFCDGNQLKKMLPKEGNILEELQALGVLNDKENESFYRAVVFPIFSLNDGPHSALYGRSTNFSRHLYTKGPRGGVWNAEAVKSHHTIILTESILDSYSLVELGFASIPLYGTNGLTQAHIDLFESSSIKEIVLMMDNDDAGREAMPEILERLQPLNIKVSSISLPDGVKDPNQFLMEGGTKGQMGELLESRHLLFEPITNESTEEDEKENPIISKGDDFVTVQYGDLTYETRGFRSTFTDTLRVVISVHLNETTRHTDRIDLYTARNRKGFSNACSNKFDLQSAKIEQDLLSLIQVIEQIQRENAEKRAQANKEDVPYQMTREEEQEALEFLRRPDLIKRIAMDLDSIGYIGEPKAKLLTYLAATSRIDQPISLIVRANAGSGKSVLFEKVCQQLMPPEAVRFYSRISAQSLFYMKRTELKNKILVIDEKAGSAESDYSLRNLMSRGKLSLAVVSRDYETGESRTVSIEMEGPVAVFESTTASELNQENLSRVFEIWLDSNSSEQTQRILDSQLQEYSLSAIKAKDDLETIIRTHQNAQRLLKPIKVVIPFKIEFPNTRITRVRRDYKRFLSLISTVTQLHQYSREIHKSDDQPYLIATKEDYAVARELVTEILESTLNPLPKETNDLLRRIIDYVDSVAEEEGIEAEEYAFTRREIREHTRWSATKIKTCLDELCHLEYLEKVAGRFGSTFRYRIQISKGELQKSAPKGLTCPENLELIQ